MSAVSAAVSALVVVCGGYLAQRYLKRVSVSLSAELFAHRGGLALCVGPRIEVRGLGALRLMHSGGVAPVVEIAEYTDAGATTAFVSRETFAAGTLIRPGESVATSEVFLLEPPGPKSIGWLVSFALPARGGLRRQLIWWAALIFVPSPSAAANTLTAGPANPRR